MIKINLADIGYYVKRALNIAFIVAMFLYQDSHDSTKYMIYFILGAVVFALSVLKTILAGNLVLYKNSMTYLAFVVFATAALFYGASVQLPAYKMFIFGACMFFAYSLELNNKRSRYDLIVDMMLGGLIICVYILMNYQTALNGRTQVLGMNVINAGVVADIAALFSVYLWKQRKTKICFIQIPLTIAVVLLSGSKSALLAFAVMMFVFVVNTSEKVQKKAKYIIIAFVIIICSYYIIMSNEYLYSLIGYRLKGFFETIQGKNQGEDESRILMIQLGWNLFLQNPLFGVGFDCFRVVNGWTDTWSHCNYIEILANFGAIGFVLYYLRHAIALRDIKKNISEIHTKAMCQAIILSFLVLDISVVNYYTTMYQILLALVFSYCNKECEDELLDT